MDTLFSHVNIVTMNEQMTLWQDAFVGVTDGKIAYMAKKPPEEQPKKIIDATGMVLMPGLINCHTHLPMYLLRGYADDLNLQDWLEHYIFPREDRLDGRAVKAAATLAIAEALRFGTTRVSDMYYFCDEICQTVAESGIKANISRGTSMFLGDDFCFDTFPACQELVALKEKWHGYDNGRIKIEASVHAEYTSTYQLWDALAEYAVNNGLQLQVHLSETKKEHDECVEKYGLTPAQVLDCHHVFDVPTVAALMAKGRTGDPTALPAEAALMMATVCGARAQGRSAECGVIELGMDADLILLDFNQPHLIPCHNVLSQLVYAASGHDVALTMVRGRILYADGKYPTLDIAGALKELHDYAIPRVFSDEPEAQA